jgi:hypothetical protein
MNDRMVRWLDTRRSEPMSEWGGEVGDQSRLVVDRMYSLVHRSCGCLRSRTFLWVYIQCGSLNNGVVNESLLPMHQGKLQLARSMHIAKTAPEMSGVVELDLPFPQASTVAEASANLE